MRNLRLPVVLALVAFFAIALVYARRLYAPCDDAYIYFVYVKNFLAGNGLTYNGLRVQGFTSILWPAILCAVGLLPFELPRVAEATSAAGGLFVMIAAYLLGRRMGLSRAQALVMPFILAFVGDFAFYMGSGLETLMFAGFLLLSTRYLITQDAEAGLRSWSLPAVLALTILARPEGALMAALVLGTLLWRSRAYKPAALCALRLAVMLAPVYLGVRVYYGSFLPNTYYAKTISGFENLSRGKTYLTGFLQMESAVLVLFALTIVLRFRQMPRVAALMVLFVFVWLAHHTVQGGDNMVGYRVFLPILPIVYLVVLWGMRARGTAVMWIAAVVLAAFAYYSYNYREITGTEQGFTVREHADKWRYRFPARRDVGLTLKTLFEPGTLVAVSGAGIIPYYSEQPTLDMLGLNDAYIAHHGERDRTLPYGHQAGDAAYVLERKPGVIILSGGGRQFISERELMKPKLRKVLTQEYREHRFPYAVRGWIRKDVEMIEVK